MKLELFITSQTWLVGAILMIQMNKFAGVLMFIFAGFFTYLFIRATKMEMEPKRRKKR